MVRELLITVYTLYFKIIFNFCKLRPLQNKIIFLVSFEENAMFLCKEMIKSNLSIKIFILSNSSFIKELQRDFQEARVTFLDTNNIINGLKCIYHLATSKAVIIDNYFAYLSAIKFKKNVECIQIWHAVGAFKNFGLKE